MNILLLLYLAHFLGDFPFQTSWVYKQKNKSTLGGLFHIAEIFIALLICLSGYLHQTSIWITIGLITATHYLQDIGKLKFNKHNQNIIVSYFSDQALHIGVSTLYWYLFIAHKSFTPFFGAVIFENPIFITYCIGLVWITYFLQVTIYIIQSSRAKNPAPLKRDWKEMCLNTCTYTCIYWGIAWWIGLI
jgi:hypothetical protein